MIRTISSIVLPRWLTPHAPDTGIHHDGPIYLPEGGPGRFFVHRGSPETSVSKYELMTLPVLVLMRREVFVHSLSVQRTNQEKCPVYGLYT